MPDRRTAPRYIRVAEEIQKILSEIFISRLILPGLGLVTVTSVKLSPDLSSAHVNLSFLQPAESGAAALKTVIEHRKEIRYYLANTLNIKYVPMLRFHLDESHDHAMRIETILGEISKEKGGGAHD